MNNIVIDSISNKDIRELFKDILSTESISIVEVKNRLINIIGIVDI